MVEQAGDEVKHLRTGQRVLAMPSYGGLAERIALPETACVPIPDALSFEAAASFLVNYCTAYHGLVYCGDVKEKETILILGASGGVGVAAIDVAKALGAEVIAAASTKKKRDACLAAGADHVINYTKENWRDEVKKRSTADPSTLSTIRSAVTLPNPHCVRLRRTGVSSLSVSLRAVSRASRSTSPC